ncbi:cellulase family glycosylhydrolase [Fulvivirgaceae bacterium PWU4]|uniref:Cellulase family glycosylhydrolase n=1 Tax=Chryseosolibacter histidini TaxID=2782349 RepID=A0AAP2GLN4_9BACT|nr:cellulase family glycosylhydrolase [Chryseosolibacter histidini]MBT1700611.1 cellulase family glycosylhydrolase [Chryseosolibacter histidini]
MNRRNFITTTALGTAALSLPASMFATAQKTNPLPKWKGFNLLDFFSPDPAQSRKPTTEDYFRWMRDWGFDFVRIPIAYPYYLNIDRTKNITPDDVYKIDNAAVDRIDKLVTMAHRYGMHVSLNLHRAPGYCINAGFHEPYNLWKDQAAQEAFYFHWNMWAKRYKHLPASKISFDLVNEPSMREDMNDQHSRSSAVPGDVYRKVAQGAAAAIRKENPSHLVIADGNNVGNNVIPEITDLNIAQSCRGYFPGIISHYKAPWANKDPDNLPEPKWPGQVGEKYLSRTMLEEYYKPWGELARQGVGVHCGECGCWNKTPHNVFMAWFTDVLGILKEHRIGFALWEFSGDFGILDSRRTDVAYEDWYGHKLDRKYLNLLISNF